MGRCVTVHYGVGLRGVQQGAKGVQVRQTEVEGTSRV